MFVQEDYMSYSEAFSENMVYHIVPIVVNQKTFLQSCSPHHSTPHLGVLHSACPIKRGSCIPWEYLSHSLKAILTFLDYIQRCMTSH